MPSVGMRRNTRVFGTRVLRSGRRFSTEPQEVSKFKRVPNGEDEWIRLVDDEGGDAGNDFKNVQQEDENGTAEDPIAEPMIKESASEGVKELQNVDRMFEIVYKRKRKRNELTDIGVLEDTRFGKTFVRKQRRKKLRVSDSIEVCGDIKTSVNRFKGLAILANDSSCDSSYWITCFLTSVLSYMMRVRIAIRQLSAFLLSQPIFDAYSSHGVLFLRDSNTVRTRGVCIISGSRSLMPVFIVDFSAIPFCFMQMHTSMYIRSLHSSYFFEHSLGEHENDEEAMDDTMKPSIQISFNGDYSDVVLALPISPVIDRPYNDMVGPAPTYDNSVKRGLRKSALHSVQLRNSRIIQKRRTSLRLKRRRPSSVFRTQKARFPREAPNWTLRSWDKRNSTRDSSKALKPNYSYKALKPNSGVLTKDVYNSSCSTNLLIIEPDKCYREEGATVTLQQSVTKQWFLAVKKDGINRYTLTAQKVMRPPFSNRLTHATVWAGDGSWKLEFPIKQDWFIFKELYKECSERNLRAHAASVIHVPHVQEVLNYADSNYLPYVRPDSYITVQDDELTRALVKKVANYDMDSDDEEWLTKFNELFVGGELQQLTPERFELIVDALEKGIHWSVDEYSDEQALADIFTPIEPVRNYWITKRKQKQSSITRIFQLYQPRCQVISKHVLRKKRSFKRQPSQGGRGKQRTFLQAIAEERDAEEQRNYLQKVQKAKSSADTSEELAVLKRQKAQKLMENADLANYKAVIALRIAEAAQVAESESLLGTVASFFLG